MRHASGLQKSLRTTRESLHPTEKPVGCVCYIKYNLQFICYRPREPETVYAFLRDFTRYSFLPVCCARPNRFRTIRPSLFLTDFSERSRYRITIRYRIKYSKHSQYYVLRTHINVTHRVVCFLDAPLQYWAGFAFGFSRFVRASSGYFQAVISAVQRINRCYRDRYSKQRWPTRGPPRGELHIKR